MNLAHGAKQLLDMRLAGKRPSSHVLVHVGRRFGLGVITYAPGCDWRCLAELDVLIVIHEGNARQAIADIAPYANNLSVWREDAKQGIDVLAFHAPADPKRWQSELDAAPDAELLEFHHRWYPPWAHQDLWKWTAKVIPWSMQDNRLMFNS